MLGNEEDFCLPRLGVAGGDEGGFLPGLEVDTVRKKLLNRVLQRYPIGRAWSRQRCARGTHGHRPTIGEPSATSRDDGFHVEGTVDGQTCRSTIEWEEATRFASGLFYGLLRRLEIDAALAYGVAPWSAGDDHSGRYLDGFAWTRSNASCAEDVARSQR